MHLFVDYIVIGKRIRERRRSRNLSQEQLADLIDKSTVFVSNLENGKKGASLESIVNICLVLDLSLDELITGAPKTYEDEYVDAVISVFQRCTDREKHFLSELVIYADAVLKKHKVFQPESIFTKKFWKP
ncbi:MAG: helix-turn-helix transcriptional regulator [Oscillospiraceae bacterium]|nr:helix-turn-helix transcriptional regulator [Oscillospiraceae bacterium]